MYLHFSWALDLSGAFEQCHVYGRCWPHPSSVSAANTARELKKGQKLQDMNPEAKSMSGTGWEGFDSSRGLFSASLYSLSPANALMEGTRACRSWC